MKKSGGGISDADHKTKAAQERDERQEHKDRVEIISALDRLTNQLHVGQKLDNAGEKKRGQRECLTIILVFLTVIFTGWSAITLKQQLSAMRAAERPFIGIDENTGDTPYQRPVMSFTPHPLTPVYWKVVIQNYGKSTATMQYQIRMKLGDNWECPPSGCGWVPKSDIVPTQKVYLPIESRSNLTDDELKSLLAQDDGVVVFVRFKYRDAYNEYPAVICLAHMAESLVKDCSSKYDPK